MAAPQPASALDAAKQRAREGALLARARGRPDAGIWLAGHVLEAGRWPISAIVAGFWPLPGEIDIRPLLVALAGRGHPIVLPQTPKRGLPLTFRDWHPGATLQPGPFGTRHPGGAARKPDIVLVPLLAFDRAGHRLGYGAG